jgi:hypothetical protein
MTASERLSEEEEYQMQADWVDDDQSERCGGCTVPGAPHAVSECAPYDDDTLTVCLPHAPFPSLCRGDVHRV